MAWFEDKDEPTEVIQKSLGSLWTTTLDHSPLDVVAWHGNLAPYRYDLSRFNVIGIDQLRPSRSSIFTVLTSPSDVPGRANADFVIFPPRWMVGEDTFRPPWFHRNVMSEAMGLIHGAYDAKADGFQPGGLSLHNLMSGHGPDLDSWRKASEAELKPVKIEGTMAFMVETCWPYRPTQYRARPRAARLRPSVVRLSQGEAAVTDATNDPALTSWCESAQGSDFPIQNLPLGIFSVGERRRRAGVAIGDFVLDLREILDLLDEDWRDDLSQPVLNAWLARGPEAQAALRERLQEILSDERYRDDVEPQLVGQTEVRLHVPCLIGDYTDFYVGIHHATNVGKQFRPDNPLLPNYKYVPIGYHGRASSVRASGEPVIRPSGSASCPMRDIPEYGPSRRLDYELELGIWIGEGNELGQPDPDRRGRRSYRRLLPAERLVGA